MADKNLQEYLVEINPMVCYNSRIKILNRMITKRYDQAFKPFGLNGNQFTLLLFIGKAKTTNQKMIADLLMINFSTVSRDLNNLDAAGWVVIDKGIDARNSKISLSAEGIDLLSEVLPVWEKINTEMQVLVGEKTSASLDRLINAVKTKS